MIRKIWHKANNINKYILRAPNPYYAFMFSLLMFLWGLYLLMPFAAFAAPIYGSHYFWGAIGFILGGTELVYLVRGNFTKLIPVVGQFMFWIFLAIAGFIADPHSPGFIITGFLAIMTGLGYVNRKFWL